MTAARHSLPLCSPSASSGTLALGAPAAPGVARPPVLRAPPEARRDGGESSPLSHLLTLPFLPFPFPLAPHPPLLTLPSSPSLPHPPHPPHAPLLALSRPQALREYLARHEDPLTGRPLFHPHITRGPKLSATAASAAPANGSEALREAPRVDGDDGAADESADDANQGGSSTARPGRGGASSGAPSFHTARVTARRSKVSLARGGDSTAFDGIPLTSHDPSHWRQASLREEARQREEAEAKLPSKGAFSSALSASLVASMREARLRELFVQASEITPDRSRLPPLVSDDL